MNRTAWGISVVAILLGLAVGIGGYTFVYAKGYSYMTNDPAACANCHIMNEHYNGWIKASHRSVAACNDCHTPPGLIPKYLTKASNGFWHSFAFTTGRYPDPLRIKRSNHAVTEEACRNCHVDVTQMIEGGSHPGVYSSDQDLSCVRCHNSVGHMR